MHSREKTKTVQCDIGAHPNDERRSRPQEQLHARLVAIGQRQVLVGDINAAAEESFDDARAGHSGSPASLPEVAPKSYFICKGG